MAKGGLYLDKDGTARTGALGTGQIVLKLKPSDFERHSRFVRFFESGRPQAVSKATAIMESMEMEGR